MAGVPIYIVHLSSRRRAGEGAQARDMGLPAYAETCPQYLFLSYDNYEEPGFDGAKYVMSPPLREKWHQDVLWKGLAKNDLQVDLDRPLPVLHGGAEGAGQGRLQQDPQRRAGDRDAADARSRRRRPAGTHQPQPLRRALLDDAGQDVRPVSRARARSPSAATPTSSSSIRTAKQTLTVETQVSKVDYNPYEGREVTGSPTTVLSRGDVVCQNGKVVGKAGRGQFIKRAQHLSTLSGTPVTSSIHIK